MQVRCDKPKRYQDTAPGVSTGGDVVQRHSRESNVQTFRSRLYTVSAESSGNDQHSRYRYSFGTGRWIPGGNSDSDL